MRHMFFIEAGHIDQFARAFTTLLTNLLGLCNATTVCQFTVPIAMVEISSVWVWSGHGNPCNARHKALFPAFCGPTTSMVWLQHIIIFEFEEAGSLPYVCFDVCFVFFSLIKNVFLLLQLQRYCRENPRSGVKTDINKMFQQELEHVENSCWFWWNSEHEMNDCLVFKCVQVQHVWSYGSKSGYAQVNVRDWVKSLKFVTTIQLPLQQFHSHSWLEQL